MRAIAGMGFNVGTYVVRLSITRGRREKKTSGPLLRSPCGAVASAAAGRPSPSCGFYVALLASIAVDALAALCFPAPVTAAGDPIDWSRIFILVAPKRT